MGAPIGNDNARKDNRLWGDTIRRAIAQSDGDRLRKIAEKLLEKAAEGDVPALRELGDRLDGKPLQSVEIETNEGWSDFLRRLPPGAAPVELVADITDAQIITDAPHQLPVLPSVGEPE